MGIDLDREEDFIFFCLRAEERVGNSKALGYPVTSKDSMGVVYEFPAERRVVG
jgi:hypothetical protein